MIKPEWGTKRICHQCGARFYDMKREPLHCPKCNAIAKEGKPSKLRRGAAPPPAKLAIAPVIAPFDDLDKIADADEEIVAKLDDENDDGGIDVLEPVKGGEEDDGAVEDASDIGEADDDLSEVLEHVDEAVIDNP